MRWRWSGRISLANPGVPFILSHAFPFLPVPSVVSSSQNNERSFVLWMSVSSVLRWRGEEWGDCNA